MFKTTAVFLCVLIGVSANAQLAARADSATNVQYQRQIKEPSGGTKDYETELYKIGIPWNWKATGEESAKQFSPEGASGPYGITHGVQIEYVIHPNALNSASHDDALNTLTEEFSREIIKQNSYLRMRDGHYYSTKIGRSKAIRFLLDGRSPITGRMERVVIYTTLIPRPPAESGDGAFVTIVMVAPDADFPVYSPHFEKILQSIEFNDCLTC